MKADLKNVKSLFCGLQGSGKTELAKVLTRDFERPAWFIVNLDDMVGMDDRILKIIGAKTTESLEKLIKKIKEIPKEKRPDLLVLDDAEHLIPTTRETLQKFPNLYDIFINHRHIGTALFFLTRRPQDLNPLVVESCENQFYFALPTSDNVKRKLDAIDNRIIPLLRNCTKQNHRFVFYHVGDMPVFMDKIRIAKEKKGEKEVKENGEKE